MYQWNPTVANTNSTFGNWQAPSSNMTNGRGYIMRASSSYGWTGTLTSQFTGVPNNGVVTYNTEGTYPIRYANYEINGDGFNDWVYVNSNNTNKIDDIAVTTITGVGSGLKVSVLYDLNLNTYTDVQVYTNGNNYQQGDLLTVKGSLLDGIDGKTYSATLFSNTGESLYFEISSFPDFDQVVQNGWRISGNGITGYGTVSNLQNTGGLWRVDIGQTPIVNNGDIFIFDNNSGNDINFEVGGANGTDLIYYFTGINGKSNFSKVILNVSQPVDFSQPGNWSIRTSKSDQGFIWTRNWVKSIGTLNGQYANSVTFDSNNNIYIGSEYPNPTQNKKGLVIKLDVNGNLIWSKYFDDSTGYNLVTSVDCDSQNNLFITCLNDDSYLVVTKSDSNGTIIWQKTMTDGNWDYNFKSTIDNSNNIIVSGSYENNSSYDYVFIKLNGSNGDTLWSKSIGSGYDDYDYWNFEPKGLKSFGNNVYKIGYSYDDNYSNGILISLDTTSNITGIYDGWEYKDFNAQFNTTNSTTSNQVILINEIILNESNITFTTLDIILNLSTILMLDNNTIVNTKSIEFSDGSILTSSLLKQNLQSSYNNYTLQLSDINGHVYKNDNDGYGIYVPSNDQVAFTIGSAITIVSGNSNVFFYLEQQNVSLVEIWGAGFNQTSTNWFIPSNSIATLLKIGVNKWMLSGAGLNID